MNKPLSARLEYVHRACLSCGKRIPRWTDGKKTPSTKVFCDQSCGDYWRRLHPSARTIEGVKERPDLSALVQPFSVVEGRPEYGHCHACGRMNRLEAKKPTFCNDRCRDYEPAPPRKPDGNWHVVTGPKDSCIAYGLVIMPRGSFGLTPHRGSNGRLRFHECVRVAGHPDVEPLP
jgi:hypothetical protein